RLTRKILQDFKRVRRFEDSADVLQGALLRLTRRLEGLVRKDSQAPATVADFFSLASGEIRRALLDLIRHYFGPLGTGRHEEQHPKPSGSSAGAPALDPSDLSDGPQRLQLWTEFHQHAADLPPEEREVFDLRWYQGLSSEEAADLLGLSLATVKRRWL